MRGLCFRGRPSARTAARDCLCLPGFARMAEGDYNRLAEAILAAEAEGISCADARTQLEALVRCTIYKDLT